MRGRTLAPRRRPPRAAQPLPPPSSLTPWPLQVDQRGRCAVAGGVCVFLAPALGLQGFQTSRCSPLLPSAPLHTPLSTDSPSLPPAPHLPVGGAKPSAVSGAPGFSESPLTPCPEGWSPPHILLQECSGPLTSSVGVRTFLQTMNLGPAQCLARSVPHDSVWLRRGRRVCTTGDKVGGAGCGRDLQKPGTQSRQAHPSVSKKQARRRWGPF